MLKYVSLIFTENFLYFGSDLTSVRIIVSACRFVLYFEAKCSSSLHLQQTGVPDGSSLNAASPQSHQ
jgi:hypothetical protein